MRRRGILLSLAALQLAIIGSFLAAETYHQRHSGEQWEVHYPAGQRLEGDSCSGGIGRIYADLEGRVFIQRTGGCPSLCVFDGSSWATPAPATPSSDAVDLLYEDDLASENLDSIDNVTVDDTGTVWIGWTWRTGPTDFGTGLTIVSGGASTTYTAENSDFPAQGHIWEIAFDSSHRAWIATEEGLLIFDPGTRTFVRPQGSGPPFDSVYSVDFSPSGEAWLRTSKGLAKVDEDGWHAFPEFNRDSFEVVNRYVIDFDPLGQPWVGTGTGSVLHFDGEEGTEVVAPSSSTCCNEAIVTLAVDSTGRAWVATREGLLLIQDGDKTLITPDNSPLNSTCVEAVAVDREDRVWVSTGQLIPRSAPTSPALYQPSDAFVSVRAYLLSGGRWLLPLLVLVLSALAYIQVPRGILLALALGVVLGLLTTFSLGVTGAGISAIGASIQIGLKRGSPGYTGALVGMGILLTFLACAYMLVLSVD